MAWGPDKANARHTPYHSTVVYHHAVTDGACAQTRLQKKGFVYYQQNAQRGPLPRHNADTNYNCGISVTYLILPHITPTPPATMKLMPWSIDFSDLRMRCLLLGVQAGSHRT